MKADVKKVIVIAWADFSGARETGDFERFDGVNYRPKIERCLEGKAAIWSRSMDELEMAENHAKTCIDSAVKDVFVMDDTDDVISQAKQKILTIAQKH